jgi:hypothetical protein
VSMNGNRGRSARLSVELAPCSTIDVPTSLTPRSCSKRKSCRPAGPGRRAASASSRG